MTRNEYMGIMKTYLLSMLCALPIVIVLDILINAYVSLFVLVVIDFIILVLAAFIGYIIVDKRKKNIARKREEFLANKKDRKEQ